MTFSFFILHFLYIYFIPIRIVHCSSAHYSICWNSLEVFLDLVKYSVFGRYLFLVEIVIKALLGLLFDDSSWTFELPNRYSQELAKSFLAVESQLSMIFTRNSMSTNMFISVMSLNYSYLFLESDSRINLVYHISLRVVIYIDNTGYQRVIINVWLI